MGVPPGWSPWAPDGILCLPGLTLQAAAIHTGRQYADNANTQKLPAWTRVDLGARYVTPAGGAPVAFPCGLGECLQSALLVRHGRRLLLRRRCRTVKLAVSVDF